MQLLPRHKTGRPPHGGPDTLLRAVFVALIVAAAFAAAGMLMPHVEGDDVAIFDPRCEHLPIVAAASCSLDFQSHRGGAAANRSPVQSR
jgi:hypothetical protein